MTKGYKTLEELNLQFEKEQEEAGRTRTRFVWIGGVLVVLLLLLIGVGIAKKCALQNTDSKKDETTLADTNEMEFLPVLLSGQDEVSETEITEWLAVKTDQDKVYIDVESQVPLYDSRAYVDVVNPIYNAYELSIRILSADKKTVYLEETSRMKPGMSIKAVELTKVPDGKNSKAVMELIFYKDKREELGRHSVDITFKKQTK